MVEKYSRRPQFWLGLAERVVITVVTSVIIKTFNFNRCEIELLRNNGELFKSNLQVTDYYLKNNIKCFI